MHPKVKEYKEKIVKYDNTAYNEVYNENFWNDVPTDELINVLNDLPHLYLDVLERFKTKKKKIPKEVFNKIITSIMNNNERYYIQLLIINKLTSNLIEEKHYNI